MLVIINTMCELKTLDKGIVLPSEIELDEIEKGDCHDVWGEDNLFDFSPDEARSEREHINRIIHDLKRCGGWIER